MKVILMQDVKSLGKKGELVEASDGYARNFLLPRKFAKEANAQAMNEYKNAENSKNYKIATQKAQAEHDKKTLEGKTFKMTAKAAPADHTCPLLLNKAQVDVQLSSRPDGPHVVHGKARIRLCAQTARWRKVWHGRQ